MLIICKRVCTRDSIAIVHLPLERSSRISRYMNNPYHYCYCLGISRSQERFDGCETDHNKRVNTIDYVIRFWQKRLRFKRKKEISGLTEVFYVVNVDFCEIQVCRKCFYYNVLYFYHFMFLLAYCSTSNDR